MRITAGLLDYAAGKTGIKQAELLEKDMLLHLLLRELTADEHFRTHYVFKGGTCLIKCYLGHYRFSEDLDFSYARQEDLEGKSEKRIRKQLSNEISALAKMLEKAAAKVGLEFKPDKKDRHYMEFGGGNKFATFKLWYESVELRTSQFIKVQVSYVEVFKYPFKYLAAKSMLSGLDEKELRFMRPEAAQLLEPLFVQAYDIREILAEKVRAILTRKGAKARDFIDVYLIQKETGVRPEDLDAEILEKTRFSLRYGKYRENLRQRTAATAPFKLGEEQRLILKPLGEGFSQRTKRLAEYADKLAKEITQNP
ncbi:MAG: nucleotidyl transferase AbiEii/AbiGii toxin family protein [Candidatus Altiarchaeota archaeon]